MNEDLGCTYCGARVEGFGYLKHPKRDETVVFNTPCRHVRENQCISGAYIALDAVTATVTVALSGNQRT